jgi:uncharacterized protein
MDIQLTEKDKEILCSVAREAILSRLLHRSPQYPEPTENCLQSGGVFVSLHENGQLRGCIGRMHSGQAVYETIKTMAAAAAFEDPRFDALSRAEISDVIIEITILGALEEIKEAKDIVIGKHGLYIIAKSRGGVLLPQVATEYGWNAQTFLEHVCLKAGLPPAAWENADSRIWVFEGLVFSERT